MATPTNSQAVATVSKGFVSIRDGLKLLKQDQMKQFIDSSIVDKFKTLGNTLKACGYDLQNDGITDIDELNSIVKDQAYALSIAYSHGANTLVKRPPQHITESIVDLPLSTNDYFKTQEDTLTRVKQSVIQKHRRVHQKLAEKNNAFNQKVLFAMEEGYCCFIPYSSRMSHLSVACGDHTADDSFFCKKHKAYVNNNDALRRKYDLLVSSQPMWRSFADSNNKRSFCGDVSFRYDTADSNLVVDQADHGFVVPTSGIPREVNDMNHRRNNSMDLNP